MARLAALVALLAVFLVACSDLAQTSDTAMSTTPTTARVPGVGDPVRDGNFEFVVHRVGEPVTEPNTFEEPLGIWVVVELSITNIKNDPQTFFASNQRLIVNGAEYEAAFALDSMVDLNPGLTFTTSVLFDVPSSVLNARQTQVELHDSMFSGGATVRAVPAWAPSGSATEAATPAATTVVLASASDAASGEFQTPTTPTVIPTVTRACSRF